MRRSNLIRVTLFAVLGVMLTACGSPSTQSGAANTNPSPDTVPSPSSKTPAAEPATTSNQSVTNEQLARFDGYGELRFGMTVAEARKAWSGGKLQRVGDKKAPCRYLIPKSVQTPAEFALMVDQGKFVRYSSESANLTAPGGGRVGMDVAAIKQRYPDLVEQNHKYVQGGKYLRVKDSAGGQGILVFETDAAGTVTQWRVGVPPQIDYLEGCS